MKLNLQSAATILALVGAIWAASASYTRMADGLAELRGDVAELKMEVGRALLASSPIIGPRDPGR